MAKVTFTLDDETVRTIRRLAERTRKPQSLVVREAVSHYAAGEQKLTDEERQRRLAVLHELMAQPVTRPQAQVEAELQSLRRDRHSGWGRPSD